MHMYLGQVTCLGAAGIAVLRITILLVCNSFFSEILLDVLVLRNEIFLRRPLLE